MYNSDDVYWLLKKLNLEWEISAISDKLADITSKLRDLGSKADSGFDDVQRSLSDLEPLEKSDPDDLSSIKSSLDSVVETLSEIVQVVNRPDDHAVTWPPVIGQVVTLQGWDYPHVVKGVEIDDGVVKYFIGASTLRADQRDVSVRLNELLPHNW
ncbi:hypothetical protein [Pseudomonas sp. UBA1879]|uniref:hypothetical protein n=1 Tax=Pseudomonas sp. UBA1879 TaxID=1947305 RepID=UPI0025F9D63B|nr:hypothetical protein [Pseudomonas sp. UBA1879]